jgi:uncharacterized Zn-binding protein involved in type VI secretion
MPPAARVGDMHMCPMVTPGVPPIPHVGGPILPPGCPTVLIGGVPAARIGDMALCVGPPDSIVKGAFTVLIGGQPAARMGDNTVHGGIIVVGMPTVLIGEFGAGSASAASAGPGLFGEFLNLLAEFFLSVFGEKPPQNPDLEFLEGIAQSVNPENGGDNCGYIIDAVIARLTGADPNATAPNEEDGSWGEIEARHNVDIVDGQSFEDAFKAVENGGDGTTALISIKRKDGSSHVVVITNRNGTVGVVEGQGGGQVITSAEDASAIYDPDGEHDIGFGVIP